MGWKTVRHFGLQCCGNGLILQCFDAVVAMLQCCDVLKNCALVAFECICCALWYALNIPKGIILLFWSIVILILSTIKLIVGLIKSPLWSVIREGYWYGVIIFGSWFSFQWSLKLGVVSVWLQLNLCFGRSRSRIVWGRIYDWECM